MKIQFVAALLLGMASLADAHFVWVVPAPDGATAQVFISEDLKPSDKVDVGIISGTRLSLRDAGGNEIPLTLTRSGPAYVTALSGRGARLVHGTADLGLTARGQEKPYLLVYYPKTILGDAFDPRATVGNVAPVEIVPVGRSGSLHLKVLAHGRPLPASEVTVILADGTQKKLSTDADGLTAELTQTGRYGAWARYWENVGGERDGKAYAETRNYATLVFDAADSAPASPTATRFATLPEATASFGAVASDGWLYVYGGHIAPTHSYSTVAVSGRFSRLNLARPEEWEDLPSGPAMQGMNLAAYKGAIYRIGGMEPRNKPEEKSATFSVADCARFDPKTRMWESLPPLPEPRSSHDVVVIGDKLIVVGGWTLRGQEPSVWLDTIEIMDLSAKKLEWKSIQQPFKRRALIAAADSGKMYVMGGFDEHGKVVHDVSIYDPEAGLWTEGPDLPGTEIDGFAPAACMHAGNLYVSVADGTLYRLNDSKKEWGKAGHATPRVAHRIVSDDKTILVIGGADKGRNSDLIEAASVGK
jgi:N-acetylneuraminic acid mutarotase